MIKKKRRNFTQKWLVQEAKQGFGGILPSSGRSHNLEISTHPPTAGKVEKRPAKSVDFRMTYQTLIQIIERSYFGGSPVELSSEVILAEVMERGHFGGSYGAGSFWRKLWSRFILAEVRGRDHERDRF